MTVTPERPDTRVPVGILISGRGSNMMALAEACADPAFPARIALVLSNDPAAAGLTWAAERGLPTAVVPHRDYEDREAFENAVHAHLRDAGVRLICLAGFMRLLTAGFVERWTDRLLNIHPSLLPAFKGLHTHERVLDAGMKLHGCTVHLVRPEMDSGPILVQAAVPVLPDDSAESLAARVLAQEHRIYPLALRLMAEERVRVSGEACHIRDGAPSTEALVNPAL
ncbi:phosphoribosylglycinamide formyltransferase [Roseospira marina]|uniref:Phosphoribosylglycinamide formyltransferase n=1 Tax=Roseospira marina TaxID=140057 RepID=A0A5M6I936_9PROT|nr:phosphoribosylglycinamide formyltransferase [Roseospira marina]KAA5604776.1 phosphoribosylglycinamide formyltransferase [Roseospira marina]MBB4313458.1 phosphoribosylglycinamide formyltransferase-1 [Roseospira marina]MBB5086620.1 phosphoribosylglycinamide formyltransferase-1 [Roseospira marina]